MQGLRRGLLAGFLAGLVLALLYLVDYGPGVSLHTAARWFALDSKSVGGYIGFLLLILLGGLFGLAFGAFQRGRDITLLRSVASGLLLGVAWLVILVFLLGSIIDHLSPNLYTIMFYSVTSLLFGLLVGVFYFRNPLDRMVGDRV